MKTSIQSSKSRTKKLSLLVVAVALSAVILTTGAGKPPTNTPLCATVYNQPGANLQSDAGMPDDGGAAVYCDSGTTGGSAAHFNSDGTFTFATGDPATSGRAAFIDVTQCLSNCGATEPPLPGDYQINFSTGSAYCGGQMIDLRSLGDGQSAQVGMVLRILFPFLPVPDWRKQTGMVRRLRRLSCHVRRQIPMLERCDRVRLNERRTMDPRSASH